MKHLAGIGLLASAFAPVVAIVAALRLPQLGGWGVVVIAGCALAVGMLALSLRQLRGVQEETITTKAVKHADEKVLAFAASHIVPIVVAVFMTDSPQASLAGALSVLGLLGIIYVRGGLFHLNPVLAVVGFRLYEVTASNGALSFVLGKVDHLPQSGALRVHRYSSEVAFLAQARA